MGFFGKLKSVLIPSNLKNRMKFSGLIAMKLLGRPVDVSLNADSDKWYWETESDYEGLNVFVDIDEMLHIILGRMVNMHNSSPEEVADEWFQTLDKNKILTESRKRGQNKKYAIKRPTN